MAIRSSLSGIGIVWSTLSCLTVCATSFGFYMQYWLIGMMPDNSTTEFNLFRRCNYVTFKDNSTSAISVPGCGRYAEFGDIPAVSWKVAVILGLITISFSLFITFLSMFACCLEYFSRSRIMARACGCIQLLSCVCLAICCLLFAYGWDNPEVASVCRTKGLSFSSGTCHIGWAFWVTASSAAMLAILSVLALFSSYSPHQKYQPAHYYE